MAFGGRELRLILSIQSYGTSNFAKVRRDLTALERATRTANVNQLNAQKQIVRQAEQLARTQDRIAGMEQSAINKRTTLQRRAANAELTFAQKRAASAQKEIALANTFAAKRLQIGKAQDRLQQMQGSGAQRMAVQQAAIDTRRIGIQNQLAAIPAKQLGLESRILGNKATLLARERALTKIVGQRATEEIAAGKNLGNYGSRTKELAYRYRAALKSAQQLEVVQSNLPREAELLNSQLAGVLAQEELISKQQYEQAAAMGRQAELIGLQENQLAGIAARQAEVSRQIATIDKQEALVNTELGAQLATLEKENIQLERARVLAGELAAEVQRSGTFRLAEAKALDQAVARQTQLLRLENRARTVAHVGRAAQFTGLLGLAGLGLAANSFAKFNVETAKAATQLRGVNEPIGSSIMLTGKLEKNILNLTKQFPSTASEMADSAYQIASGLDFVDKKTGKADSGIERLRKTTELLKVANQVAAGGQTDLASATDSLISVFNSFDPHVQHQDKILNTLFATVRFGRGDFTQFEALLGQVSAAANAAGQSFTQAGGAVAFLTTRLPRGQAATGYARLIQGFGSKEFVAGFKSIFGVAAQVGGKLRPLSDIINIMVTQGPKVKQALGGDITQGGLALQNLFQNVTARGQEVLTGKQGKGLQGFANLRKALTFLVRDWKDYRDVLNNVSSDSTEANKAILLISQQPGFKWQVAINQFKAFGIIVGQTVLPVLLRFIDKISDIVHWFENLPSPLRNAIGKFGALAAIFLLIGGTITTLIGSMVALAVNLKLMSLAGETAITRMTILSGLLRGLAALAIVKIVIDVQKKGLSWKDIGFLAVLTGVATKNPYAAVAVGGVLAGGKLGASFHGRKADRDARQLQDPFSQAARQAALQTPGLRGGLKAKSPFAALVEQQDKDARKYEKARMRASLILGPAEARRIQVEALRLNKLQHEVGVGFQRINKTTIGAFRAGRLIEEFKKGSTAFAYLSQGANKVSVASNKSANTVLKRWQDLSAQLTGVDVFGGITQQAATAAVNIQLDLAKAQATGTSAQITSAANAYIKALEKQIAPLEKLKKEHKLTAAQAKQLYQLWTQLGSTKGIIASQAKATDAAAKKSDAAAKAVTRASDALDRAKERVQAAMQHLAELKDEQMQQLEGAFGQLFQGPLQQGPLGQAFQNIAQQLSGFGVTFPIPATLTLGDMSAQQRNFEKLTRDIGIIQKRAGKKGIPKFALDDILQDPSALNELEGIIKGGPATIDKFIKNLRLREKTIKAATKSPWEKQLIAADHQLTAAKLQLKAARAHLTNAKTTLTDKQAAAAKAAAAKADKTAAGKTADKAAAGAKTKTTGARHAPVRTTSMVGGGNHIIHYHGDDITVHTDETNAQAIERYLRRRDFSRRNKGIRAR